MTLLALAIVAGTGNIYAQYASDALRFSQTNYGSSSRFKGLGNAQTSLGGDISSLGGNPAGLGMFTRSEFSLTPEFNNVQNKATFLGQSSTGSKSQLNLNQAGVVWYNPVVKKPGADLNKGLLSFNLGIGYNRNNDYTSTVQYGGVNANNSIGTYFNELAQGFSPDDLNTGFGLELPDMAFKNYLIDQVGSSSDYISVTGTGNNQVQNITRSGSTSELNFSAGLNFSNQLYLGASLGIVNVHYVSDSEFNESGTNRSVDPDNIYRGNNYTLSYRQNQTTDGSGVNARLGLIFKPVNTFRIGATFQTPTWMRVEDHTYEVLDTKYNVANGNLTNDYVEYPFTYSLRTPYKGSLGASVILGANALLTADVDYVDYASMKFSTTSDYNDSGSRDVVMSNNNDVRNQYTGAMNYRVGGEYKIGQLSLRAGYGLNGSPYKDDDDNVFDTKYYSGGLGYRFSQFYFDAAYQRVETNNTYNPYLLNDLSEPTATVKSQRNNVFLTFGVKF